ncbi:hypothetical protein WOLCODRAFT_67318, partial [Wolfiporia cocos MD-104 SS10]
DVSRAAASSAAAFRDDPIEHYLRDTPDADQSRISWRWRSALLIRMQLTAYALKQQALTVNHGDASLAFLQPCDMVSRLVSLVKPIIRWLFIRVNTLCDSPEQRRRRAEYLNKLERAEKGLFGERADRMYLLRNLSTSPAAQGRGYASILVRAVTEKARHKASYYSTWLSSSNVGNTSFYERCGFVTVGEFTLGDGNPTWTEPPLVVLIVSFLV